MADFYSTLGVAKGASQEDIKKAYRKLAHEHHPDKGKGDAERFKQVNEAYQTLSDPDKRRQYDQFGSGYQNMRGPGSTGFEGFDFSGFSQGFGGQQNVDFDDAFDIFSDIFGGGGRQRQTRRERGIDLEMELNLTFEEAAFGVEKEISVEKRDVCPTCEGSGAESKAQVMTCPKCHGTGQIRMNRRTIFGQVATVATCDRCTGTGKVPEKSCKDCSGSGSTRRVKTLKVQIPAGVEDGMRIRMTGEGEVGYKGSNFGDLYLHVHVAAHKVFKRHAAEIHSEAPISFFQAALGADIEAETLDGKVSVKIPAGTQSGKVFRLKSKGVPIINTSRRGDHLLTVVVVTPTKLSKKEKEIFKKLAEENGESVNIDEGFWSRFTK